MPRAATQLRAAGVAANRGAAVRTSGARRSVSSGGSSCGVNGVTPTSSFGNGMRGTGAVKTCMPMRASVGMPSVGHRMRGSTSDALCEPDQGMGASMHST
eukprot:355846-Chlamydomonas_euryale.AAC.6